MSDLREAAKLALTALENGTSPNLWLSTKEYLRQALAQPEHNCDNCESLRKAAWDRINELEGKLEGREWVGLTDDEIDHTPVRWTVINGPGDYLLPFARAIEAKLKEKNT